jgi:toxin FitB
VKYLLDTNLVCRRDHYPKARGWILQHQLECVLAAVTVAEMVHGVEQLAPGPKRASFEQFLRECLQDFDVLPFDTVAAFLWGKYVVQAGRPLPVEDSYIAAIAKAHHLTIVTENGKDFPGCDVFDPLAD